MKAEHIAISERIAKHLETQMAQSVGDHGCAYRGDNGNSCAVGCLMTDEAYASASAPIEGRGACSPYVKDVLEDSGLVPSRELENLLMSWQAYHDGKSGGPKYENWLEGLVGSISPTEFHQSLLS